jgi:sugar phosphate isomerase/epimerase
VLSIGLNPYGLAYTLGIYGAGTTRANPSPWSVDQYVGLTQSLGVKGIELHSPHLHVLPDDALRRLRDAFERNRWWSILARPAWTGEWPRTIQVAKLLGAKVIRMHLTPVLCGDRADAQNPWPERVKEVRRNLKEVAERLGEHDLKAAIENHQDFCSEELVELCESTGTNVGITLDTANPLSVGEDPIDFARTVAPRTFHLHLKDYRVQWSDQGYRLIRCPTGSGCIPFPAIADVFKGRNLTAAIEIGALDARHIKCFNPGYWMHHPPRTVHQFSKCLAAARCKRLDEHEDHRTPWERNAPAEEIVAYELAQVKESVENLRTLGWMDQR